MDTKLKGDIAEQAAILALLKKGWQVLRPVGDRLPYDLVADVKGQLVKIQVKSAWWSQSTRNFAVDTRRTKTNRRQMVRDRYNENDFDFAMIFVEKLDLFYVLPVADFISYGSEIQLVENDKRQRKPKSTRFREAFELIEHWAAHRETDVRTPVKFGEAVGRVIPSQAVKQ